MAQISVWCRGRQYLGSPKQPLADSFKECEAIAKGSLGDYIVLEPTFRVDNLQDSILFAWGRIMWHSTQVDLTQDEIRKTKESGK